MHNRIWFRIVIAATCFLFTASFCFAANNAARVDNYMHKLKTGSVTGKTVTARDITESGLSSTRLFDYIERELLKNYPHIGKDRFKTDLMAWYCKALASSGNPKYKATIKEVLATATNRNLLRHAQSSLGMFDYYAKRNETMRHPPKSSGKFDAQTTHLLNLLNSGDFRLQRDAAKEISRRGGSHPILFNTIEKSLRTGYKSNSTDKNALDTMAWYCKALAASNNAKYKAVLQDVVDGASSAKLKKYARQSLNRL